MHICFVEDTPYYGGGQEWIVDTITEFSRLGHSISIIVPNDNEILINQSIAVGANIHTYDWDKISKNPNSYKTSWLSGIKNADVAVCSVHPPRDNFHCVEFAAECIKDSKQKTVLVPKTGTLVSTYLREYYSPNPKIKTRIATITKFTKRNLGNNYKIPSRKIKTIYQGVNIDKFESSELVKYESNRRYGRNPMKPTIGVVGKFEIRKGHIILLETIKELKDNHNLDINVSFVGDGSTKEMIENKIIELKLENNVKIFPFTTEPQYFYDSIDALVLPSLYKEGLPNVILEAMAMGKPCIASQLAGTSEVVKNGKTGFLVEPGNTQELAAAVKKLINSDSRLSRMGGNAKIFVSENFDRKKQAVKYLEHFMHIAKRKSYSKVTA
jgi:glycosyltransferase involved in cell wall biosynthesis